MNMVSKCVDSSRKFLYYARVRKTDYANVWDIFTRRPSRNDVARILTIGFL